MYKVSALGRLTADPELKTIQTANGESQVCNGRIATRDIKGETFFTDFSCWGKQGQVIAEHFKKGNLIFLMGNEVRRTYEYDGQTRLAVEIRVNEFEFVEPKKTTQEEPDESEPISDGSEEYQVPEF